MCSGMVFTASGMLTKQTSVQHPFGNAADEFGNAKMDREGLGWVRVWSGTVQVGSGLQVDKSRRD